MNNNPKKILYSEDEINLKELILTFWKRKNIIICFTLIAAILAGAFSVFFISPVYNTKLNIVISMPEKYNTRYGDYVLPITTNEQYINLITSNVVLTNTMKDMGYNSDEVSMEILKECIVIEKYATNINTVQNSFVVNISANSPEESLKLAQTLYDNYIEFMDVMTKERAVSYFINKFTMDIKSLGNSLDSEKEILKKNQELLSDMSQTIEKGEANIQIQTQLTNTSNYVLPVGTINPNYIKIENDIVENKQSIINIENAIRMNKRYLAELDTEKQTLTKYYETGRTGKLDSSVIGIVETSIYLPSPPVAPTNKTSPSNTLNTAIGVVFGGLLGVIVVLVKEYWSKEA